jgi:hypothetical protein
VTRLGLFERLLNSLYQTGVLGFLGLLTILVLSTRVSQDQNQVFESQVYNVPFDHFSPAFAAFEDDYLFEDKEVTSLKAGQSAQHFQNIMKPAPVAAPPIHVLSSTKEEVNEPNLLDQFDGGLLVRDIQKRLINLKEKKKTQLEVASEQSRTKIQSEELKFGALATLVAPPTNHSASQPIGHPQPQNSLRPKSKNNSSKQVHINNLAQKEIIVPDSYQITGPIELKEGLAFLGSMEVSWVVGDNELQRGSINVPDGTFEINVSQLVGDIIISLYDNKDELIGEGIFNLTHLPLENEHISTLIEVHPIDWDTAGEIVHSDSLGSGVRRYVEGANVALYAFNDATESKEDGSFSFYNWQKTNSRTLAIASKPGFIDSIFMLDSKKMATIALFTKEYVDSFFGYIEDLGVRDVKDQGMIYGEISGLPNRSGFRVYVENEKPIYFQSGLASLKLTQTTSNGLFAFVGLQDGDYKLLIEKKGEIVDEKLVVVEQGKISPVHIDLGQLQKHLEFFDPLRPDQRIEKIEIGFFDGAKSLNLESSETPSFISINNGGDPGLMHLNTEPLETHTFISKNKDLQKIPYLQDDKLFDLAKSNDLDVRSGLIFGFVNSSLPYRMAMIESPVDKIIYFDEDGRVIDHPEEEIPFGFIMGGFPEGLSSLIAESREDQTILATDLIYSDHTSVSVIQMDILPLE